MPITDYKVTDVERNAVYVQSQNDTFIGDPDTGKAIFDAYPELIRDNLDGLCDFLNTMSFYHGVDTAAATNAKKAITSFIPVGAIITMEFAEGNTASSPTIIIDGVNHTIIRMPTTAKLSTSSGQTYRFRKSSSNTITFLAYPDYICEYGTVGTFKYARYASGEATLRSVTSSSSGTLTMTQVSTSGIYISGEMSLTLPSGLFNNENYTPIFTLTNTTYVVNIAPQFSSSTASSLKYMVQKGGSSTSEVSFRVLVCGTWK